MSLLHILHAFDAVANQVAFFRFETHPDFIHSIKCKALDEVSHSECLVSDEFEHRCVAFEWSVKEFGQNLRFYVVDDVGTNVDI